MRPRWLLKACPSCGGDLILDEGDPHGSYDCLQCSRPHYPVLPPDYATYRLQLEQDRRRRQPRTTTLPLILIDE
jgi:hypothetical protein